MKTLIYLLQVSACTGIFYSFYFLLLRRLTFFTLNRWYLLVTLLLSFVIPTLTLPVSTAQPSPIMQPVVFVQQIQAIDEPVVMAQSAPTYQQAFNWLDALQVTYIAIAAASVLHLLVTIVIFLRRTKSEQLMQIGNVKVLKGGGKAGNSSFMNVIFIDDHQLAPGEVGQIITHEMLHIKLMHSADRLLARMIQVVLWFNPFAYCYMRSIEENHEFEVDRIAAGDDDKGMYAELLFKLATSGQSYLFHSFSRVPLKTRIAMLFNKPTSNMKKIIYVLVLPVVVISCLAFANLKPNEGKKTVVANTQFYTLTKFKTPDGIELERRKLCMPDGKAIMGSEYKAGEKVAYIVNGKVFNEREIEQVEYAVSELIKDQKQLSYTSGQIKEYKGTANKDLGAYTSYFSFDIAKGTVKDPQKRRDAADNSGALDNGLNIDTNVGTQKYKQKTRVTKEQLAARSKSQMAFHLYAQTEDYKRKVAALYKITAKTVRFKVISLVDTNTDVIGGIKVYRVSNGDDQYLLRCLTGQDNQLIGKLNAGDEIDVKVGVGLITMAGPALIEPLLITKNNVKIFEVIQKTPDYAFLYEGNRVRFTDGKVTQLQKYPNGKWKSAVIAVNGFNIKLNVKPTAPSFGNIQKGDQVRFRFVHEVKTGAKEYTVNDWVAISTDIKDYGIKNPDYFYKFYEKI